MEKTSRSDAGGSVERSIGEFSAIFFIFHLKIVKRQLCRNILKTLSHETEMRWKSWNKEF